MNENFVQKSQQFSESAAKKWKHKTVIHKDYSEKAWLADFFENFHARTELLHNNLTVRTLAVLILSTCMCRTRNMDLHLRQNSKIVWKLHGPTKSVIWAGCSWVSGCEFLCGRSFDHISLNQEKSIKNCVSLALSLRITSILKHSLFSCHDSHVFELSNYKLADALHWQVITH